MLYGDAPKQTIHMWSTRYGIRIIMFLMQSFAIRCPISFGLPHPHRHRHPCPGALCAQNTAILWLYFSAQLKAELKSCFLKYQEESLREPTVSAVSSFSILRAPAPHDIYLRCSRQSIMNRLLSVPEGRTEYRYTSCVMWWFRRWRSSHQHWGGARLKYIAGIWRHGSGIAAPRVMPSKICLWRFFLIFLQILTRKCCFTRCCLRCLEA